MQARGYSRSATAVLTLLAVLFAAIGLPRTAAAQEAGGVLNIVIVEGEGAVNNIRQRVAREPIVRVEDENRRPVAGASVVFLLPGDGPSGTFPGGERMITVQTDESGQAVARGLRPNNVTGEFTIRVTASFAGRTATAIIGQTNTLAGVAAGAGAAAGAAAGGISAKVVGILVVVGAAVAGGTYAATRGNGGSSPQAPPARTPTSVSLGTPTVGAP